jgi:hypothetical protein
MADRRYTVTFDANINQFTTQVKKAGESFHKFSGNIDADVKKVELGFSGIVKQFTLAKVGIKGLEKGFETFKKIMQSTGSGEDKLAILTAGVETGI